MSLLPFGEGRSVHFEKFSEGRQALLFVHGWLGSSDWWAHQIDFFAKRFSVVCMDLPGHGKSSDYSNEYSPKLYSESIVRVAERASSEEIVVVAHSMAAPFSLMATLQLANVRGVILVDTLKNLEQHMSYSQADSFLFKNYRADFPSAVRDLLPKYLFAPETPMLVRERLQKEFLRVDGETAVQLIEPLYRIDVCEIAKKTSRPVRAISSDVSPTNEAVNRRYFTDYSVRYLSGTGHYPMLEVPDAFNSCLSATLDSLGWGR